MKKVLIDNQVFEVPDSTLETIKRLEYGAGCYWNSSFQQHNYNEEQMLSFKKDYFDLKDIKKLITSQERFLKLDWIER